MIWFDTQTDIVKCEYIIIQDIKIVSMDWTSETEAKKNTERRRQQNMNIFVCVYKYILNSIRFVHFSYLHCYILGQTCFNESMT